MLINSYTWLKKLHAGIRFQVDPTKVGDGTAGGAGGAPAAVPPLTPEQNAILQNAQNPYEIDEKAIALLPDWARVYIRELRGEAKGNRIKASEHRTAAQEAQAEATRAKAEADAATAALKGETDKTTQLEDKVSKLTSAVHQNRLDTELRAHAAAAGIPDKYLKLIDRTGITVGEDLTVEGIPAAVAKFKAEYAEVIPQTPPAGQAGQATPPAEPKTEGQKWSDNLLMPGSTMTYKEYNDTLNKTADLSPSGSAGATAPVNALSMTKDEYKKAQADMVAKLPGKK